MHGGRKSRVRAFYRFCKSVICSGQRIKGAPRLLYLKLKIVLCKRYSLWLCRLNRDIKNRRELCSRFKMMFYVSALNYLRLLKMNAKANPKARINTLTPITNQEFTAVVSCPCGGVCPLRVLPVFCICP